MKIVVDLDLHEAVQDIGNRSPARIYEFKSQDTIAFQLYFVRNGIVQDLGAGFALKFGLIATGDTTNTILAYQTTAAYLTDADGNVYYQMQVVMNTSQMATAMVGQAQLPCTAEIRYQDPDGEIVHSLNISALVFPTILVETGVTPPGVSTGYPDASTLELLVHKNQPGGYAGLSGSGSGFITNVHIFVDGNTITSTDPTGLATADKLTYLTASFVQPAANATVVATVANSARLVVNQAIEIISGGYYIVTAISGNTVTLKNNGDPYNLPAGMTVAPGGALRLAQATAASGGTPGAAGANAYTTLSASFVVPAVGTSVTITVGNTSWVGGIGQVLFIALAGYYSVAAVVSTTSLSVTNLGYSGNAAPTTNIPTGGMVSPGGVIGTPGTAGSSGANAYDKTASSFVMPAAAASVSITIGSTAWLSTGQVIYITGAGYFSVASISNPSTFAATNLNYSGNAGSGITISANSSVSPAGLIGAQGAGGAGLNAFTTLTNNYTQPAVASTVSIKVGTTAWMAVSQAIFVQGGGYYTVASITDLTNVVITNLGYSANAAPGATVSATGTVGVVPSGVSGATGTSAFTNTTANFTMPTVGNSVSVPVNSTGFMVPGLSIYVQTAGYFTVATVTDSTHVLLTNQGVPGNIIAGNVVASGAGVVSAGATGPAGPGGSGVGSLTDAETSAGTSWIYSASGVVKRIIAGTNVTVTDGGDRVTVAAAGGGGGGGPFDPRTGYYLYEDFVWYGSVIRPDWEFQPGTNGGSYIGNDSNNWAGTSAQKGQGVIGIATGGATSGAGNGGAINLGNNGLTANGVLLGPGILDIAGRIGLYNTPLPPTGQAFEIRFGLWLQGSAGPIIGTNPYQCVFLSWSPDNNSGLMRVGTAAGNYSTGTLVYNNCTAGAVTAAAFHWWELKIDASGNITAIFDGATIGSFTGAPLGMTMVPFLAVNRNASAATNWQVLWDTLYIYMPYTRS